MQIQALQADVDTEGQQRRMAQISLEAAAFNITSPSLATATTSRLNAISAGATPRSRRSRSMAETSFGGDSHHDEFCSRCCYCYRSA